MKKLLIVMVVALLALALVACGETVATTTKGATTTAAPAGTNTPAGTTTPADTNTPTDTTAPTTTTTIVTTTVPETTTTPVSVPPMQAEINAIMETAWWNQVHRMNPIAYNRDDAGNITYTWSLTIKAESGLFYNFPEDHPEYPNAMGISFTTGEGAVVYIKDMNKDTDYTKYNVKEGSWRTERWCDIWFEAEGFVPQGDAAYDMYLVFNLPTLEGATPYPGEQCYIWALEEPWIFNPPNFSGVPEIDEWLMQGYQCTLHRHNERSDISWAEQNATEAFDPTTFPAMNFNFTVKAEDRLFNGDAAWQAIIPEGAFAYVKTEDDAEFTRYEVDYMLLERYCDMWFTLKDFTPVEGQKYEIYLIFKAGVGATHEYAWHYVYANDWEAGAGDPVA